MTRAEEHARAIEREGFTIVDGAIAPERVDRLVAAIDALHAELAVQPAQSIFAGQRTLRVPLEVARGLSPGLGKLAGFGLYHPLLGHIDRCSPVDLLDGTGPRRVVGEL